MPVLDGLKVVRSAIHGYGVIALRRFTEGEVVCWGDDAYQQVAALRELFGLDSTTEPEGAGAEVTQLRPREAEGHRD